jgi:hypothetical protein
MRYEQNKKQRPHTSTFRAAMNAALLLAKHAVDDAKEHGCGGRGARAGHLHRRRSIWSVVRGGVGQVDDDD